MPRSSTFNFRDGNLAKVLALPLYALGFFCALIVPRSTDRWVFGSGIGPLEGALALAIEVSHSREQAKITWIIATDYEERLVQELGFTAHARSSLRGFWETLRAKHLVVTHGFGDVNRFAVFGAILINLWHGPPLKRLHLDASVTTDIHAPGLIRRLLEGMYRAGAARWSLVTAGSPIAAGRLRTAFRVQPGIVQVTGDPRLDDLANQLRNPVLARSARERLLSAAGIRAHLDSPLVLYAPTWRDGAPDAAIPDEPLRDAIRDWAARHRVHLLIRSHPLGRGDYRDLTTDHEWVHELSSEALPDLTNVLSACDLLITDYSSVAMDYALTGRPILWFAPDLDDYERNRGLYEPYEITTEGHWTASWEALLARMSDLLDVASPVSRAARLRTNRLRTRFHTYPEGNAAARVLQTIDRVRDVRAWATSQPSVFFESFYGRIATCNPAALDREFAGRFPAVRRFWSVTDESVQVPDGAEPVLVGGPEWHAARRYSSLLIVNDWLRFNFARQRGQFVLQTWHGTPLKRLALDRDHLSLRTRLAIRRESRRWSALLSQNAHCTETLVRSYAYNGTVLQVGYPRNDRLARVVTATERLPEAQRTARGKLALPHDKSVLFYAPTWRESGAGAAASIGISELAAQLGPNWLVLARGHSRAGALYHDGAQASNVVDVTDVPDVNDLMIAADVFVTDYSSLMFDASVARVPTIFLMPDMEAYRNDERGFTLDVEALAPGPIVLNPSELGALVTDMKWVDGHRDAAVKWRTQFNPHDDGDASARVLGELERLGALDAYSDSRLGEARTVHDT